MITIRSLFVGLALASQNASALDLGPLVRPIDATLNPSYEAPTLKQIKTVEGSMELGRALFTIGRTDLLGLDINLDSFAANTLETPLGGHFSNGVQEDHGFQEPRLDRRNTTRNRATKQTTSRHYRR